MDPKLSAIERIYGVFGEFASTAATACRPGCAACCTRNVVATTLEGRYLLAKLPASDRQAMMARIGAEAAKPRFQPHLTINHLAELCARGQDPPEDAPGSQSACPLLSDLDECAIYPIRPFGCRCMVSRRTCEKGGFADMEPLMLTVNTVFQQIIEHVDAGGCTGNLTDVLLALVSPQAARAGGLQAGGCHQAGLLSNRPIPVLMVPPQHRDPVRRLLHRLGIPWPGR